MIKAKFTKGPWVVRDNEIQQNVHQHFLAENGMDDDGARAICVNAVDGSCEFFICDTGYEGGNSNLPALANAHLIAAAPTLYETLATLVARGEDASSDLWAAARIVLAKARGES